MRKLLLLSAVALGGMTANAQNTYCVPAFSSGCTGGDVIDDFRIPSVGFEDLGTGCSQGQYDDKTSTVITLQAGVSTDYTVTHSYAYQHVKVWIDFNNDGVFDDAAPELVSVAQGVGTNLYTSGVINIPATVAVGQYRMRIATKYNSNPIPCNVYGYGEAHDYTVSVTAPPSCLAPSGLSSSNVEATTADVSWVASTSTVNGGYQVYYSMDNTVPDDATTLDATNSVTVDATTTMATLENLVPESTYYAWVRANCSDTDNSPWSSSVSFTTIAKCLVPTGISSSNVSSNSADISWTASASTVSGGYQVYYSTNNTAPDDATALDNTNSVSVDASATTATLSGLNAATTYYAWVRANCDDTESSHWSSGVSFTTACVSVVPDYTQDFNSLAEYSNIDVACWSVAKGGTPATGYTTPGDSYWRAKNFLNNAANTMGVAVNLYNTNHKDWLISPTFDLSDGTAFELTFNYGVTFWNGQEASGMGSDDYVQVLVSTDQGATWTVVHTWDTNNAPSNEINEYTLSLTPYVGNQVMIAIYATDGSVDDNEDYRFFVDNFAVKNTSEVGTINQELTSLEIYPNPAKDVVNISNDLMITNVEVFDINGRRLLNQNVGQTSTTIDVSSFTTGTYFVKVTAEGKTSTKQIIVK